MRLGIDGREFQYPGFTGIGRYLSDFLHWLTANRPDVTPVLFLNQRCHYMPPDPSFEIVIIPEGFTPVWDQILLPRALMQQGINVFFSPYMKMPFRAPCPVVLIANDLIPLRRHAGKSYIGIAKKMYFRVTAAMAVRRAARIICISEFTRREIISVLHAHGDIVSVAPLAVRPELHPIRDTDTLRNAAYCYGLNEPYILYLGHLKASKNVDSLVRAYALLPEALRRTHLLALGGRSSDTSRQLITLAQELGIADRVRFLDFVADTDANALISGAAVFVYPSLDEGFGLPPLEAMACGAPVVCSAATSLAEVIGDAALGVNPPEPQPLADAMRRVLEDPALRAALVDKGPPHAATFTVERMARVFMQAADDLAGISGDTGISRDTIRN